MSCFPVGNIIIQETSLDLIYWLSFVLVYRLNNELENLDSSQELDQAINIFIERNIPINAWPELCGCQRIM